MSNLPPAFFVTFTTDCVACVCSYEMFSCHKYFFFFFFKWRIIIYIIFILGNPKIIKMTCITPIYQVQRHFEEEVWSNIYKWFKTFIQRKILQGLTYKRRGLCYSKYADNLTVNTHVQKTSTTNILFFLLAMKGYGCAA